MDFIIGGAYQGKLDFARGKFLLGENDIYTCSEQTGEINFDKRCIDRIEEFTLWCVRNNVSSIETFKSGSDKWQDSVLICRDIFCGVVPMGADMRKWREETGRLCGYLSREADTVTRVFCGLPQKLK